MAARTKSEPAKPVIYQIQILRFVAAAMVLVSHVQHEILSKPFLDGSNFTPFEPVFWAGGVDIFFVISGFIMYHVAHSRFGVPGAPREFVLRRIARVAPPYWGVTVAMLLAIVLFHEHINYADPSLQQIVGSFLFIPLPDPYGKYYPVMILGWTLNFEMLFYAVFAVGMFFSRRVGMAWIVLALCGLGFLPFFYEPQSAPLAFWAKPLVLEFLFGIGLAHLRVIGWRVGPAAGWGLFALGFAMMVAVQSAGFIAGNDMLRPLWMGLPAFVACAGPALMRESSADGLGPAKRALVFGGDISYSLYLTHPFAINLVALAAPRLGIADPWVYVIVVSIAALATAAAVYLLFERPLTLGINGWLSRRKPVVMQKVPSSR